MGKLDGLFKDYINDGMNPVHTLWLEMEPDERNTASLMDLVAAERQKVSGSEIILGRTDRYLVELVLQSEPKDIKEALTRLLYYLEGMIQDGEADENDGDAEVYL